MHRQALHHARDRLSRRENIHDLRNLFGVVASARHLLDDSPAADRRTLLLDAIEDAALRGGRLTTDLLAAPAHVRTLNVLDLNHHLLSLEPLMRALAGRHAELRLTRCGQPLPAKLDFSDLDSAILELVANASAALAEPGRIIIRTKRVGSRLWLLVADTGRGMSLPELKLAQHGFKAAAATGTGLGRVQHFAQLAHGRLRLRSREQRGTVAVLILPLVLKLASRESAAMPSHRTGSPPKEI